MTERPGAIRIGAGAQFDHMEPIRVYRNINTPDKYFGLELADGCALLLAFFAAFMVNREGLFLNGLFLVLVYLGLRALKRGKPPGYLLVLTRYALMTRFKRPPGFESAESSESAGTR